MVNSTAAISLVLLVLLSLAIFLAVYYTGAGAGKSINGLGEFTIQLNAPHGLNSDASYTGYNLGAYSNLKVDAKSGAITSWTLNAIVDWKTFSNEVKMQVVSNGVSYTGTVTNNVLKVDRCMTYSDAAHTSQVLGASFVAPSLLGTNDDGSKTFSLVLSGKTYTLITSADGTPLAASAHNEDYIVTSFDANANTLVFPTIDQNGVVCTSKAIEEFREFNMLSDEGKNFAISQKSWSEQQKEEHVALLVSKKLAAMQPASVQSCPIEWRGDGFCDVSCNNAASNYDNGDCCAGDCKATSRFACEGALECKNPKGKASIVTTQLCPGDIGWVDPDADTDTGLHNCPPGTYWNPLAGCVPFVGGEFGAEDLEFVRNDKPDGGEFDPASTDFALSDSKDGGKGDIVFDMVDESDVPNGREKGYELSKEDIAIAAKLQASDDESQAIWDRIVASYAQKWGKGVPISKSGKTAYSSKLGKGVSTQWNPCWHPWPDGVDPLVFDVYLDPTGWGFPDPNDDTPDWPVPTHHKYCAGLHGAGVIGAHPANIVYSSYNVIFTKYYNTLSLWGVVSQIVGVDFNLEQTYASYHYFGTLHSFNFPNTCSHWRCPFGNTVDYGWSLLDMEQVWYGAAVWAEVRVAHSMGNCMLAGACLLQQLCGSKWYALSSPLRGSHAVAMAQALDQYDPYFLDMVNVVGWMLTEKTTYFTPGMSNSKWNYGILQSGFAAWNASTFVSGAMSGDSGTGSDLGQGMGMSGTLLSQYCNLGMLSSINDGAVDFDSQNIGSHAITGPMTFYSRWYYDEQNHFDTSCTNGDFVNSVSGANFPCTFSNHGLVVGV